MSARRMQQVLRLDGTWGWFDANKVTVWMENSRHNGRNFVSMATGEQFEHEQLYLTARKRWVLRHWSQWQGRLETFNEITLADAAIWFAKNETDADELPEQLALELAHLET